MFKVRKKIAKTRLAVFHGFHQMQTNIEQAILMYQSAEGKALLVGNFETPFSALLYCKEVDYSISQFSTITTLPLAD